MATIPGTTGGSIPDETASAYYNLQPVTDSQIQGWVSSGAIVDDSDAGQVSGVNTTNNYTPPDPYAQWGGQTNYNNLVSGFNNQKQNIFSTANDAIGSTGRKLSGSILDFIDQYRSGQQAVDERGIQADLAKRQGTGSILDMVGRGIRSGGVMLANKNASDSSAAEGIARAYSNIGQRQMGQVGNQYAQEQRSIGMEQEDLGRQVNNFNRDYEAEKLNSIDGIVNAARDSLAQLDAAMLEASMPERIAIEQEKNRIRSEALASLQQYDQQLATERGKVNPMSADARRTQAAQLQTAGVAATNPFDFNTQPTAQFQNSGPAASNLPLFSPLRNREE